MGLIDEYLNCKRRNNKKEFNEICEKNNIYGMYRVSFENALKDIDGNE